MFHNSAQDPVVHALYEAVTKHWAPRRRRSSTSLRGDEPSDPDAPHAADGEDGVVEDDEYMCDGADEFEADLARLLLEDPAKDGAEAPAALSSGLTDEFADLKICSPVAVATPPPVTKNLAIEISDSPEPVAKKRVMVNDDLEAKRARMMFLQHLRFATVYMTTCYAPVGTVLFNLIQLIAKARDQSTSGYCHVCSALAWRLHACCSRGPVQCGHADHESFANREELATEVRASSRKRCQVGACRAKRAHGEKRRASLA